MAAQAFVIGYFIAQIMAFRTVEYAFQIGMRLRQISGRNLRTQLASKQGEENDDMKTFIFQLKIGLNCVLFPVFFHRKSKPFGDFHPGFL